jgi:predicted Rossmann fold nucleotide-binding protein DprA/Smf involved in DNA uptake
MSARPVSIPLPSVPRERVANLGLIPPESLTCVGNAELLNGPMLCVIASRSCPGNILLQTVERVPEWLKAGKVIISGFHSPLEQQVLRSALRRNGRAVKVLARGMSVFRAAPEEKEAVLAGNMLVVTAFPSTVKGTTRETALERNRLALALAEERYIPWVDEGSPLKDLAPDIVCSAQDADSIFN